MIDDLMHIFSIKRECFSYKWDDVEKKMEWKFPSDYKDFVESFGGGVMNDFFWVLSPFSINENLNLMNKAKEMKEAYLAMKKISPEICRFDFWNGINGLIPWGITENGDEIYWNMGERQSIVVFSSRYADVYTYNLSMSEFLEELLLRRIECPCFPDDFWMGKNQYVHIE